MNKRLAFLEQHVASGSADAFAYYGLAMEYRKLDRLEDALATFGKLRQQHPDYLPMYLMAGQTSIDAGRGEEARSWLTSGIELAKAQRDTKTLGELETALSTL
jgi:predicted Zn-dependent protease